MANTSTIKPYSLDVYMSEKEKELERAREAAKQEADIGFAKLQKYLQPSARTAAQGYSQGLSETAMIAAENSRQRAHAAADAAYTSGYNDLMAQYRTEKTAEQDALYADVMGIIDGGEWNTTADLHKYLYGEDGKSGATVGLSEAQKSVIAQKYGSIAQNSEQQASDNTYEMTGLGVKKLSGVTLKRGINREVSGDNFVVSDGDNNYRVEIGQEIDAGALSEEKGGPELLADLKKYIGDGEVFTYKGNLIVRDGDKFYTIRGRGNRDTKQINALKAIANQ